MRESQNGFQHANQGAPGGALLRCIARSLQLHFGNFQVPVTKLVPDKLVNPACHMVQPVVGKALRHISFDPLQSRHNPAISV